MIGLLTIFVIPKFINGNDSDSSEKRSMDNVNATKPRSSSFHKSKESNEMFNKKEKETKNDPIEPKDPSNSCNSTFNKSTNDINRDVSNKGHDLRKSDTNYLLKDLISKEVNKIKGETDNLSNMLKEKIEAANIEGLIDKTVCGIVELKDDLMRMNEPEVYGPTNVDSLRKRCCVVTQMEHLDVDDLKGTVTTSKSVDAFIKKEIDAIKKEATVIPAVLSNANSAK